MLTKTRAAVLLALAPAMTLVLAISAAGRASGAVTAVGIQHYMYMPSDLHVQAGDTVTWTNADEAPHTVTTSSGPDTLDSPELAKGQSWSFTFTAPGTYSYYCTVHPDMKATVTVAAPAAAPPPALPQPDSPAVAPSSTSATTTATKTAATNTAAPGTMTAAPAVAPALPADEQAAAPELRAVTTTVGPRIDPMLVLGALASAVAVFGVLMWAGRRQRAGGGGDHPA